MTKKTISLLLWTFVLSTILYGVWLLSRVFLLDQFVIPTDSMRPTLIPGDRVIVDKTIMGARIYSDFNFNPTGGELKSWRTKGMRRIKHNDIVIFNFPHHDWHVSFVVNNVFCKRCLALPGDTIWSEGGYYRNNNYKGVLGVKSEQERFNMLPDSLISHEVLCTFPFNDHFDYTTKNLWHIYVPRKGDVVSITPEVATYYKMYLEWELGKVITCDWSKNMVYADGKQLKRHVFRHNYYFMAGDNVLDSSDSRYWGLVPEEYIVGVVTHVSYSRDKHSGKLGFERLWRSLNVDNGD